MSETLLMIFAGCTALATVILAVVTYRLAKHTHSLVEVGRKQVEASNQDTEKMKGAIRLHAAIMHQLGFYVYNLFLTEKKRAGDKSFDIAHEQYGGHNQPAWAKMAVREADKYAQSDDEQ